MLFRSCLDGNLTQVLDSWSDLFGRESYTGHRFLKYRDAEGKTPQPTYLRHGEWLSRAMDRDGYSNQLFARAVRCITEHAPIGEYYVRFNIPEPPECPMCGRFQTRAHVLHSCRRDALAGMDSPSSVNSLYEFLERNPLSFAFRPD